MGAFIIFFLGLAIGASAARDATRYRAFVEITYRGAPPTDGAFLNNAIIACFPDQTWVGDIMLQGGSVYCTAHIPAGVPDGAGDALAECILQQHPTIATAYVRLQSGT